MISKFFLNVFFHGRKVRGRYIDVDCGVQKKDFMKGRLDFFQEFL